MRREPSRLLLFGLVVALAVVAWLLVPVRHEGRAATVADRPPLPESAPLVVPFAAEERARREAVEMPRPLVEIRVVDEQGGPLPGAGVRLVPLRDRCVDPEESVDLGVTDSGGSWKSGDLDLTGSQAFRVSKEGYQAVGIAGPVSPPSRFDVTLVRGATLTVHVRTVPLPRSKKTDPVEGVSVCLSSGVLPYGSTPAGEPGVPSTNAIFHGNTDSEGRAVFRGLRHGQYDVRIGDQTLMRKGANGFPWSLVDVDQEEQSVTYHVAPLVASVLRFEGDDLVYAVTDFDDGIFVGGQEREVATRVLRDKFPGTYVSVGACPETSRPVGHVSALFTRKGSITLDVVLDLVRAVRPRVFDVSQYADRTEAGGLTILVEGPDGLLINGADLILRPLDIAGGKPIRYRSGARVALPAGRYRAVDISSLGMIEPQIVDVPPGRDVSTKIASKVACSRVEFSVRGPGGEVPRLATLQFTRGEWSRMMNIVDPESFSELLPNGEVQLATTVPGNETETTTLRVGPATERTVLSFGRR